MASLVFYNAFRQDALAGAGTGGGGAAAVNFAVDAAAGNIKLALVDSTYVPSSTSTDQFFGVAGSSVAAATREMANGGGYVTGGIALTSSTVTTTGTTTKVLLASTGTGINPTWSQNAGGFSTARYAILYKVGTSHPSNSPVIGFIDLGSNQGNVNGDFTVGFDQTNGAFTLQ